jgi:hypothetical protein
VRNKLEMRINRPSLNQPDDCIRRLQPGSMRKINCYRVSHMANAAVLVFENSVVPVTRSLQRERHHDECQQRAQQPVSDVPPIHQCSKTPLPMTLRRSKRRTIGMVIVSVSFSHIAYTCRTSPSRATNS